MNNRVQFYAELSDRELKVMLERYKNTAVRLNSQIDSLILSGDNSSKRRLKLLKEYDREFTNELMCMEIAIDMKMGVERIREERREREEAVC